MDERHVWEHGLLQLGTFHIIDLTIKREVESINLEPPQEP